MSTRTPETERAPAPPARIMEPSAAPGRPARSIWIAVVVALLVGGLVGYLIGWNLAPADTETITVPETLTETIAPPAYVAGTEVEAQVAFDGAACMFSGPTEVNAGTQVAFTYAATVANSSLIVAQVAPGVTYEQVVRSNDSRSVSEPPPWLGDWDQSEPVDARQQTLSIAPVPGTYVVVCATNPDTSTGDVFTSTMIRVVGS